MPVDFSTLLSPQWEAGTGRKRQIPYSGVMAGAAAYAPEERYRGQLTDIENERIAQVAEQFNRTEALQREALKTSEEQAKTASLIQMGGLGVQGAYLATRPEVRDIFSSLAKFMDLSMGD